MKTFNIFLTILLLCNTVLAQHNKRPNIILFVADDLGYNFISPYGNKDVKTPNLDKLASQGVCFDNMFTSTAMCSPTRQTLYTGLYPVRNGAYPNHSMVYDGTKSIAHYLQALGYKTALLGKRHFGPDASFPFELLDGKDSDETENEDKALDVRKAAPFIKTSDKPYFLIVAGNEPHVPLTSGDAGKYPPGQLHLPPGFVNTTATRIHLSKYLAEITYTDSIIGDCMKMVEASGEADNTIFIFTSEQGGQFPFAKWTCYDDGLKTAFIVRWPSKIKPGTRNNVLLQYADVTPTLIEIAGGNPNVINTGNKDAFGNTGFDGKSFDLVLNGDTEPMRKYVYGVHTTRGIIKGSDCYPIRSIRNIKYLYIQNLNHKAVFENILTGSPLFKSWVEMNPTRATAYQKRPAEELYDIQTDPYCLTNLASEKNFYTIKKDMQIELSKFMKQQGDKGIETEMKAFSRQPKK